MWPSKMLPTGQRRWQDCWRKVLVLEVRVCWHTISASILAIQVQNDYSRTSAEVDMRMAIKLWPIHLESCLQQWKEDRLKRSKRKRTAVGYFFPSTPYRFPVSYLYAFISHARLSYLEFRSTFGLLLALRGKELHLFAPWKYSLSTSLGVPHFFSYEKQWVITSLFFFSIPFMILHICHIPLNHLFSKLSPI